jgi:hypothetical protein
MSDEFEMPFQCPFCKKHMIITRYKDGGVEIRVLVGDTA